MHRKFIATIAATSIFITALGALPVAAGDRDAARAIAAILGVAVIGKIIHDKSKKKKQQVRHYEPVRKPTNNNNRHHNKQKAYQPPRYVPPHVTPRPLPQRVNRKLLPKNCFRNHRTRNGSVQMFSDRCLSRNYAHTRSLPRQCKYTFSTVNGDRLGYEARCMRDAGYRLARG